MITEEHMRKFLKQRNATEFKGFRINIPKLNQEEYDFQVISTEEFLKSVQRGEETYYEVGEELLDLEQAFEWYLEYDDNAEELEKLSDEDLIRLIEGGLN